MSSACEPSQALFLVSGEVLIMLSALFFPQLNSCHACGRGLSARSLLCPACEAALSDCRLAEPSRYYRPLELCLAVYSHDGLARELLHRLKYGRDPWIAVLLGQHLAAYVQPPTRVNLVIPVPLYATRQRERGFNQAELLARAYCACAGGLPLETRALVRVRDTSSQVGRSRSERLSALRGAFAVTDRHAVQRQHICLVDDVLTTGATAMACAETLRAYDAASVTLITACRS